MSERAPRLMMGTADTCVHDEVHTQEVRLCRSLPRMEPQPQCI